MKKRLLIIVLFFSVVVTALADDVTITGRIIDQTTSKPLDFVNVTLYKKGTTTPVTGGFSDADGKFELTADEGEYTFKATFIGFTEYSEDISATRGKRHIKIGNITLSEDARQISEVEVIGQKSTMTLDIDKKIFNVEQSILGDGASASEILENIPSINVDTEGNISLRNNSSVEIWINGRPSGLSDTDKGNILEMLPADAIKSVEVISNPSSKYNPEGSAGIINIILKEESQKGYFGSANVGLNYREKSAYPGAQAGANLTYNTNKLSFNINGNIRFRRSDRSSYLTRDRFSQDAETTYLKQTTDNANERLNGFLLAGFTYRVTDLDEIGVSAYGMVGGNESKKHIRYVDMNQKRDTTLLRDRNTTSDGIVGFYNITANYKHTFIKDIHEISASANYNGRIRNSESYYNTDFYDGDLQPIADKKIRQKQTLESQADNISIQTDYFNKINKNHKIEAGLKADIKFNNSYDHTYDYIFSSEALEEDFEKYNPFTYREQIYAAYLNYAGKFNWFSLQAGVRLEETITYNKSINSELVRSYFQPFPSIYLGFQLNETNTMQLSYTRRINRPRGRIINNFIDRSDPANITYGNPWLMPEFNNVVEFNYLKEWQEHSMSVGLFFNHTENVIQRVSWLASVDVMETTFKNITYSQSAGAEIVAKNRLFKNYLDLTTTLTAYYYGLAGSQEYNIKRQDSFSWSTRINAGIKIISNLSAQLTAYYNSPIILAQGSQDHRYGMDIGLKANFLKKRLTLSFSVKDVLNSREKGVVITESDNFYQESYSTSSGRSYRLTLTYNFGNLKAKSKDKKNSNRDESNDFEDDI